MWNAVIGQERIKKILRQSLEAKKLPHAYLFSGTEGVGKDAAAIELAKTLNCLNPLLGGSEACDECDNCRTISSFTSQFLVFVTALAKDSSKDSEKDKEEMIGALREEFATKGRDPYHNISIPKAITISVDQIRELRLRLAQSLTGGKKRVVIISEADTMRKEAQNAFLKTLEEPHENTLIILTSSNPSRLLPTIHSRAQELRFDLLSAGEIASELQKRDSIGKDQAEFLARLAGGSFSVARSFINEDVNELRTKVIDIMLAALKRSRKEVIAQIDGIVPRQGGGSFLEKRQTVEQFLHLLSLWLRDSLAVVSGRKEFVYNVDLMERLERFSAKFGTPAGLLSSLRSVDAAMRNTRLQLQLRPVLLTMMVEIEEALVQPS